MPLRKAGATAEATAPATHATPASGVAPETQAKPAPAQKREPPMTKDDYWRRREERDIEKDKHIRLSGVLQALLDSVNFGQYCTVSDENAYLAKVEEAALRLAKFITEKAQ